MRTDFCQYFSYLSVKSVLLDEALNKNETKREHPRRVRLKFMKWGEILGQESGLRQSQVAAPGRVLPR